MKKVIIILLCVVMVVSLSVPAFAAESSATSKFEYMTDEQILMFIVIVLGVGLIVGLITILVMRSGMKTAVFQHGAREYIDQGTYELHTCRDIYLYSTTHRVRRSNNND